MVTREAPPQPRSRPTSGWQRYRTAWTAVAVVAATGFVASAVLQSPPVPLLGLVAGPAVLGGVMSVTTQRWRSPAPRFFVEAALAVAAGVLVLVGIGHHVTGGLALVGVLGATSPWTLRWIVGG